MIHQESKRFPERDTRISPDDRDVVNKVDVVDKDIINHDNTSKPTLSTYGKHDTQSTHSPGKSSSASGTDEKTSVNIIESEKLPSAENLPSRIQRYIIGRYTWYLNKFQHSLETEMPDTFHMFRIFTVGLKEFIIDFK